MRGATHIAPLLLLLVLACSDSPGSTKATDTDSATDSDADTDSDSSTDTDTGLEIDTEGCVVGDYTITDHASLTAFEPYPCITGDLYVYSDGLSWLDLPGLVWVGGNLWIHHNSELSELHTDALTSVGGDLALFHNPSLDHVGGLAALSSIGESLIVTNNDSLTDLDGLSALDAVPGILRIAQNEALQHLQGLSNVTAVGDLTIAWCPLLASLDGLAGVTAVSQDLVLHDNAALPDCAVCGLLEQLAEEPNAIDVHDNLDDWCTPVPDACPDGSPCPGYTGSDPCCVDTDPCGLALNDICDCDSTCAWDAVDCEW